MGRPIWSGAISFGLVNIPVKLMTAVSPKDVHFHMLHDADGARIKQKRVCSADGEEVSYDHIVKGYELSKDQYVIVKPEELEALNPKATRSIDIESFVDAAEIDPIYYESSYYLVADKGAHKAYALLLEAMRAAAKVGIARVVLRTKQYLCAVRPTGETLTLSTMYFEDEVVPQDEVVTDDKVHLGERELKMAEQLIESLTADFDPSQYKDDYREQVLAMIESKAAGQELAPAAAVERPGKVVDLVAALEASLAARKAAGGGGGGGGGGGKAASGHGGRKKGMAKAAGGDEAAEEAAEGGSHAASSTTHKRARRKSA